MEDLVSDAMALAATTAFFSLVTAKHGRRRWLGLKDMLSPRINETRSDDTFHIPDEIQRRFRRIMFGRTMLKNPFLWQESAQRLHDDMLEHVRRNGWQPARARSLDVVEWAHIQADREGFYRSHVQPQRPCIIKHAPYDQKLWTTEHVRSIWGDNPMVIHDLADRGRSREMTLNQMVEFNKRGDGCAYMSFNYTFFDANKKLLTSTMCTGELHDLLKKRRKRNGEPRADAQLFISTESTHPNQTFAHTYMHCANNVNMFFNIQGRKRWVLVDPEYSLCVYPSTFHRNTGAFMSLIKASTESMQETERFPLYEYCPRYQVDLEEGDVLFIPCWWWHSVETLTASTLSIAVRLGPQVLGSLFPGDTNDPNNLFTSLQVTYPLLKKEVFETLRTRFRSQRQRYDGSKLRPLDVRQELGKDYEADLTRDSAETVRMWRDPRHDARA
jgi:hypothetical protein